MFLVPYGASLLLFDCEFDQGKEDFNTNYKVFLMPRLDDGDLEGSWQDLSARALRHLGVIDVDVVRFDPTRREFVDLTSVQNMLDQSLIERR